MISRTGTVVGMLGQLVAGCCLLPGTRPEPSTAPALTAPPSSPELPIGSPEFCPGDDRSGVPLATSTFRSTLDLRDARETLHAWNELCGDTACEGSFEWYAYDLRGDAERSELTLRTYSSQEEPVADVTSITVSGNGFTGRVLGQRMVPSCTSPCAGFDAQPRWAPCMVLDLRCEIAWPASVEAPWNRAHVECGIALEQAIRARVPEFFPEHD
jgi:hypothetical protein